MSNNEKKYEDVCSELIELSQYFIDDYTDDMETIEMSDDDGTTYKAELIVDFEIDDVLYALCVSPDDELMVLRRDEVQGEMMFSVVDEVNELLDVTEALKSIMEDMDAQDVEEKKNSR